uniref:Mitochondrial inner membrane protein OXA1 n=1 Tax=Monosporozyma servazzii TaxID=27293 RepID=OXA1_MONSE|nr:RecName: Full=Mitochondrial inner membrane protein OXA1; AltName: Full=Cytochrome oxidase biogenesis protein OXA1; AltName: Full=Oxidase assembly protein 1; Flags: Precursor [Kazachstania servazzii]AAB82601.1 Oxa1p [Kazachstania servazzii]
MGVANTSLRYSAFNFSLGRRFKSTSETLNDLPETISEVQTQLPSIDQMTNATADIVEQASHSVGELSTHIGYLNSIGLAQTWHWPADIIQHALEYVHVYTGLPWWGTICTVTILVRLLMFPIYVKSSDTIAKNSRIKPQMDKVTKELMATTDLAEGQKIAVRRRKLLSENGIKNRWLAAPMLQLPIAIGFFNALRSMANFPVDGFANQGILWFHDLTLSDPYLGLQFITAAVLMSFSRLGGETGAQQFSGPMKRFFIILPLVSIPATMNLSTSVVLYFAINGTFSVLQTLVLRNKWFRKKLNIAEVVQHPPDPTKENSGIFAAIKENMNTARERSEKRKLMKEEEERVHELIKKKRTNERIRIIRRPELKK